MNSLYMSVKFEYLLKRYTSEGKKVSSESSHPASLRSLTIFEVVRFTDIDTIPQSPFRMLQLSAKYML